MYTDANVSVFVYVKSSVLLSNDKRNADYPDSLSESKLSCSCCKQTKCSHFCIIIHPQDCVQMKLCIMADSGDVKCLCVCVSVQVFVYALAL